MINNKFKKDIIIFEGLDRVGKSTHIKLLKDKLIHSYIQYIHCTGPDKYFNSNEYERNIYQASTYYNQFKDIINFHNEYKNSITIFDRAFIR